jgi:hypothetical protein
MTQNPSEQSAPISRANLPSAVQRWLDKTLPPDQELPTSIRIEQEGTMEIRDRWTPFQASGIYEASPLSFNWQARLRMLPGMWVVAEDGHADGQGWGSARLWGIISMGSRSDREVLTAQMVRNLGELPWLPAFALADTNLKWSDEGETSFSVQASAGDQEVSVCFEINDQGEIIRAYSPSRPYDVPDGYAAAPWFYTFSEHRQVNGWHIPTDAIATFEKKDGPWEYFRGKITDVIY